MDFHFIVHPTITILLSIEPKFVTYVYFIPKLQIGKITSITKYATTSPIMLLCDLITKKEIKWQPSFYNSGK